jgi:hypothetical protein
MPSINDPSSRAVIALGASRLRLRRISRGQRRLDPAVRGMIWTILAGFIFSMLNAVMRGLALEMHPLQAQFLRYLLGAAVMLPLILRSGLVAYLPTR